MWLVCFVYVYMYICTYVYMYICIYVYYIYVYTYICISIYTYVYVCMCMYICVKKKCCIHMEVHTEFNLQLHEESWVPLFLEDVSIYAFGPKCRPKFRRAFPSSDPTQETPLQPAGGKLGHDLCIFHVLSRSYAYFCVAHRGLGIRQSAVLFWTPDLRRLPVYTPRRSKGSVYV